MIILTIFVLVVAVIEVAVTVSIKRILAKAEGFNWNQWKPAGPRVFESRWDKIVDVLKHKRAYLTIQKRHWHITLRGIFHDCDKLVLLLLFPMLTPKEISKFHKIRSHHHSKAKTDQDFRYQIIDFECSSMTKPDAPMRAREYISWKHSKSGISDFDFERYQKLMDEMRIQ